ncbi:hypothetical protein [Flavobacterium denitrificans]|uniref:hypothetical protein n=1 Tax=Flavobacterium denitrificans TaxID=281361 RepID=UPI00041F787B|nr:hypothetical protein [Flavobacterium denitrificans]
MILLEARTALRRATKYDLFTGDLENMNAVQKVKDCTHVFILDQYTKEFMCSRYFYEESDFVDIYHQMAFGLIGIITPFPNVITNEYIFDLVLREASLDDLRYTPRHLRYNQIFYTYASQKLIGPFYIDRSTTTEYLENLVEKKQIFIPHERQHFKDKSLKKTG